MGVDIGIGKIEKLQNIFLDTLFLDREMIIPITHTYKEFENRTYFEYLLDSYKIDSAQIKWLNPPDDIDLDKALKQHEENFEPFNEQWIEKKKEIIDEYENPPAKSELSTKTLSTIIKRLLDAIASDESILTQTLQQLNSQLHRTLKIEKEIVINNLVKILAFTKEDKEGAPSIIELYVG